MPLTVPLLAADNVTVVPEIELTVVPVSIPVPETYIPAEIPVAEETTMVDCPDVPVAVGVT